MTGLARRLELPPARRIHGVVTSVDHVHRALARIDAEARPVRDLGEALHAFSTDRLALTP